MAKDVMPVTPARKRRNKKPAVEAGFLKVSQDL